MDCYWTNSFRKKITERTLMKAKMPTTKNQRKAGKALHSAFTEFEKRKDGLKLLQFDDYKCQKYGLVRSVVFSC